MHIDEFLLVGGTVALSFGFFCLRRLKGLNGEIIRRKQAEEALRESELKYRITMDASLAGICVIQDLTLRYVNPAMANLLGYTTDELIDRAAFQDLVVHEQRDRINRNLINRAQGEPVEPYEIKFLRKDGLVFDALAWGKSIAYQGRPASVATLIDISEQKRTENALLDHQAQLASLAAEIFLVEERERRRIAAELHDQIGQTLAFARIKLNLLSSSFPSPDQAGIIGHIRESVDQSIREVRSLTLQISPPLLYEIGLEAAVEWLSEQFLEKYDLRVEIRDDRKPKPLDEEIRATLFQVVRELLLNIVKHADTRMALIIFETVPGRIKITIEDAGAGFDSAEVVRRLGKQGGFGLFSVRQRISHLGGEFSIESKAGRGTRVTLLAPLKRGG